MPSSVTTAGPALWLDGPTDNGLSLRQNHVAASFLNTGTAQVTSGVLPSGGALAVSAASGMNVTVATGYCVAASSSGSTSGGYLFGLMSAGTLSIATSDPTNPRIDLVCASVTDLGSSSSTAQFQVITGTPAPTPSAPAAPANSVQLATVLVPAGSSSVTAGNIADKRAYTGAAGGIVPVTSLGSAPAGYTGLYVHDLTTGRLAHNPAAGAKQPVLLPFTPAISVKTATTAGIGTTAVTIASVTVTTDGVTDLMCVYKWAGVALTSSGSTYVNHMLFIDSTQVDGISTAQQSSDLGAGSANWTHGASVTYFTSGAQATTPSAGTHTIAYKVSVTVSGQLVNLGASAAEPSFLRVSPVPL